MNYKKYTLTPMIQHIKSEIYIFLTAVMFFTRIPIFITIPYSPEMLNASTRYFTIIGLLIGLIAAGIFILASYILPTPVAIVLSMLCTIYITGAFHEDGFADFCDGFGGGSTPEKILTIMKDSRLGTYGTIGLLSMLTLKYISIFYIPVPYIPILLISAHVGSRTLPVFIIHYMHYVQDSDNSKSKPIGKRSSIAAPIIAISTFCISFAWNPYIGLLCIVCLGCVYILFSRYIRKKIGGYTGDVLGALQQISEVTIYFTAMAFFYTTHI